jgi:hypothetical protein
MARPLPVLLACLLLGACATKAPVADHVELPKAPPSGEPLGLVGATPADLRAAFGTPAFIRKDGGIETWRYDGAGCRAFFFLYPQNGNVAVKHVETLPRGASIAADEACLARLRAAKTAPVS